MVCMLCRHNKNSMKNYWIVIVFLVAFLNASAQQDSSTCEKEINKEVWKPFVEHLMSGNKKSFRALHSKRVTRVLIDKNQVQDYEDYFPLQHQNDTIATPANSDRQFELRFDKRICNGSKAWETGFYKGTVVQQGKPVRTYYGRFFVVLEKGEGVWK